MRGPLGPRGNGGVMLPRLMRGSTRSAVACMMIVVLSCGGEQINGWPTYEVRGRVQTTAGAPVRGVLVEMETYYQSACGTEPLTALSWSTTDVTGRYRIYQQELSGVLRGCLRLVAHPDTNSSSEPTAVVDLPVDRRPGH